MTSRMKCAGCNAVQNDDDIVYEVACQYIYCLKCVEPMVVATKRTLDESSAPA